MNLKLQAETEYDKNITTLANVQAKCRFCRLKGACKAGDCATCKTKQAYDTCYNAMAMCDRLRVDDTASTVFYNLKHNYAMDKMTKRAASGFIVWFVITVGMALLAALQGV